MTEDIKHILWLLKQIITLPFKGDLEGSIEACQLLKMHLSYDHKRVH